MNIIESISSQGVKTTDTDLCATRLKRPASGDIVDFGENQGKYPFTHGRYGMIESVNGEWGAGIHLCCELGRAFLLPSGNVSISGGPFTHVKLEDLESAGRLHDAQYWNWGNNSAGRGKGIYYTIARPVFKLNKQADYRRAQPKGE